MRLRSEKSGGEKASGAKDALELAEEKKAPPSAPNAPTRGIPRGGEKHRAAKGKRRRREGEKTPREGKKTTMKGKKGRKTARCEKVPKKRKTASPANNQSKSQGREQHYIYTSQGKGPGK